MTTVLCLHRVSDELDFFWPPIKIATFCKILEYISRNYDVAHLSELETPWRSKPRLVVSFDDGYRDFIEHALPELNRYGLPSNHNVVIDCVEKNEVIWTHDLGYIFSRLRTTDFSGTLDLDGQKFEMIGRHTPWASMYQTVYRSLLGKSKEVRMGALKAWKNLLDLPSASVSMMN